MSDLADRPAQPDLIGWSLNGLLALRFPRSRSQGYAPSVAIARSAEHYAESMIGTTLFHWAGFGRSRDQLARALSVVHGTHAIKGFELYAGGQMLADWYRAEAVLRCAMQAGASTDTRAHCMVMVNRNMIGLAGTPEAPNRLTYQPPITLADMADIDIDAPVERQRPNFPFPCRYLVDRQFRFQPGHPASVADQLHAGAVRYGCDWCPNFQPREN